jgi:hypothetical protein
MLRFSLNLSKFAVLFLIRMGDVKRVYHGVSRVSKSDAPKLMPSNTKARELMVCVPATN